MFAEWRGNEAGRERRSVALRAQCTKAKQLPAHRSRRVRRFLRATAVPLRVAAGRDCRLHHFGNPTTPPAWRRNRSTCRPAARRVRKFPGSPKRSTRDKPKESRRVPAPSARDLSGACLPYGVALDGSALTAFLAWPILVHADDRRKQKCAAPGAE